MNLTNFSVPVQNTTAPKCFAWLKDELPPGNITLEVLNEVVMRRSIGGIIFLSTLIPIGLIGNIHVLIAYSRYIKKTNYTVFVLWLASIDTATCVFVMPCTLVYLRFPVMYPSAVLCKVYRFVAYITPIISTLLLIVIAADRQKKVFNLQKHQFKTSTANVMCLCCMVCGIILACPAVFLFGIAHVRIEYPDIIVTRCLVDGEFKDTKYMAYYNFLLLLVYIGVSLSMIIIYTRIGRRIYRDKFLANDSRKTAQKTTITFCIVTFAYILTAFPHHLLAVMFLVVKGFECSMSLLGSQLFYTFIWSLYLNYITNPFIYAMRDEKFWIAVKTMYRRK